MSEHEQLLVPFEGKELPDKHEPREGLLCSTLYREVLSLNVLIQMHIPEPDPQRLHIGAIQRNRIP